MGLDRRSFLKIGRRRARRRGAQHGGRAPDTPARGCHRGRRRRIRSLDGLLPSAIGRARQARRRIWPRQLARDVRRRNARRAQLVRRPRHTRRVMDDLGQPRHRSLDGIRRRMGPSDEGAPVLQHRRLHFSLRTGSLHGEDPGALDTARAFRSKFRRSRTSRGSIPSSI